MTHLNVKPVYLCVLNDPYKERIKRIHTVGYISTALKLPDSMSRQEKQHVKQEYTSRAAQLILEEPMKELYRNGIRVGIILISLLLCTVWSGDEQTHTTCSLHHLLAARQQPKGCPPPSIHLLCR
jgi:hypothetical protein